MAHRQAGLRAPNTQTLGSAGDKYSLKMTIDTTEVTRAVEELRAGAQPVRLVSRTLGGKEIDITSILSSVGVVLSYRPAPFPDEMFSPPSDRPPKLIQPRKRPLVKPAKRPSKPKRRR